MFPGQTSSDFIGELRQYFGAVDVTNHHPWFMTVLFGTLYQLGMFVTGSPTGGALVVTSVQTIAMATSFAYFGYILQKLGCPKGARVGIISFFALCPIFPIFATWCVKNTLSAVFLAHFVVQVLLKLFATHNTAPKYSSWPAICTTALLSVLSRNDNIYIVVVFLAFAFIILKKKRRIACVAAIALTVALFSAWGNILLPTLGIAAGDVREALSLPLLQTTRVVELHQEELSETEINALQAPSDIPLEDLTQYYSLRVSDNVKNHYTFENDELGTYFKTYFELGLRYPDVYTQVFLARTFGYWYPGASDGYTAPESTISNEPMIHPSFFSQAQNDKTDINETVYSLEGQFPQARHLASSITQLLSDMPMTSLLFTPALYFWASALFLIALVGRNRRYAVAFVPIIMLFLICCASPLNGSVRYALPIVFIAPLLFGWACLPKAHSDRDDD